MGRLAPGRRWFPSDLTIRGLRGRAAGGVEEGGRGKNLGIAKRRVNPGASHWVCAANLHPLQNTAGRAATRWHAWQCVYSCRCACEWGSGEEELGVTPRGWSQFAQICNRNYRQQTNLRDRGGTMLWIDSGPTRVPLHCPRDSRAAPCTMDRRQHAIWRRRDGRGVGCQRAAKGISPTLARFLLYGRGV